MKNPIKNVTLAFPCEKKWKDLKSNGKKRFCSQCQHTVKDFTKSTAEELQLELSRCARVCGRFRSSQLHPSFLKTAAVTSIVAASLGSCAPDPQIIPPTIPPPTIPIDEDYESIEVMFTGVIIPDLDSIMFRNEDDE